MRRILLIAAMLLPVSSAMAAVTITAVPESNEIVDGNYVCHMRLDYSSDANVRAFALDINTNGGVTLGDTITNFKVGESNAVSKGYGIFPGRFRDFINPSNPNWQDPNYIPVTPWNAPGAENTGLGWPRMVVELGTLYSGDANRPNLSGTLFKFDVNSEGAGDCNVKISLDALRGGVVGEDANPLATNLPATVYIDFPAMGCTVPNCVGGTDAACRAAITAAGFTAMPAERSTWPTAGQAVGTVIYQLETPGSVLPCDTVIDYNDVNYPIKPAAPNSLYANWVARGKPQCWAFSRQCRGDTDGKKLGNFWVAGNDNTVLKSGISKLESLLNGTTICADFDHKKLGNFWVAGNDNTVLKSYISKLESLVPVCGNAGPADANYHYFCLPTGATCPAGYLCAPAGNCPNSP